MGQRRNKNRVFSGISPIHWTTGRRTLFLSGLQIPALGHDGVQVSDAKIHSFHKHALSVELGQAWCRDAVNAEEIRPEQ